MAQRAERVTGWVKSHRNAMVAAVIVLLWALLGLVVLPLARRVFGIHPVPPSGLTILLTADTRGHLEPCGCRSDQSGGLPVRATLVKREQSYDRLLVDAGNVTYGSRTYDLIKFHYILKGMEEMSYDAVNLGATEVMLDKDDLLAIVRRHPRLPFVSCNVVDARSRRPLVEPFVIKKIGDFKVGIVGVCRNNLEVIGKGLSVTPPIEALNEWAPRVAKQCDYLIVAAFVDQETMQEIAEKFYEVDVVLGGDVPQSSSFPEEINRALVFSVTDKGKVLGRIRLRRSARGGLQVAAGGGEKVEAKIPTDPQMVKIIGEFKEELRRRRIELSESEEHLEPIVAPGRDILSARYVGAAACRDCHSGAHKVWQNSPHTHSLGSLKPRKNQFDPECLACHTLGYGVQDGYSSEDKTPQFASVQCESCHGRGSEHVEAMRRGKKLAISVFRAVTPNTCIKCHDEENSANFNYTTFWPRIAHR